MKTDVQDEALNAKCLAGTKEGCTVTVVYIRSGEGLKCRLAELGVYAGERVTVLRNQRFGPVLVKVKDSTFMLGRGMAEKIFVR